MQRESDRKILFTFLKLNYDVKDFPQKNEH